MYHSVLCQRTKTSRVTEELTWRLQYY